MSYQKFKIIEEFLNNELSELQAEGLEKQLKEDKNLYVEFRLHSDMSILLSENKDQDKLQEISERMRKKYS